MNHRYCSALVLPLLFASAAFAQGVALELEVTAPAAVAGVYVPVGSGYGPSLADVGPLTASIVLVEDGVDASNDACQPLTAGSAAAVAGKIALVDRGTCSFVSKTQAAQNAGAIAIIIANNVGGTAPPPLGGSFPSATIPTVGITQNEGTLFKANLLGLAGTLSAQVDLTVLGPEPCVAGLAGSFACLDVDLMAKIPLPVFTSPGTSIPSAGNDIWGWTDALTGREYALMGLTDGVAFVDVSDPGVPVYLGKLPTATVASSWRDVKVYQDYALIGSEASNHGMQVFDLTKLRTVASPPETFMADATYTGAGSSHNVVVVEGSNLAILVGATQGGFACNGGGLHMIDISTPTSPTFAGCFDTDGYTHDAQCVVYDGPDTDYTGSTICFASNEHWVTIADVTIPTLPVPITKVYYTGDVYTHQNWLSADKRFLIVNDELDGDNATPTRTLVLNVEDLDNAGFEFDFAGSTNATDHNLYIRGQHVFQSNYTAGLRILDGENIGTGALQEVAYFDTYPTDDAHAFHGQWSNYPYFESGTLIASDINNGLFVLRPNLLRPGFATVTGNAGWRLLAAPAPGMTVDALAAMNLVQGVPGYYPPPMAQPNLFTGYDGTTYSASAGSGESLALGQGFWWYMYDQDLAPGGASSSVELPLTLTTSGTATAADVDVTLHGNGFNMAGNPFGSSVDLSGLGSWAWTGGSPIQATAHVWDAANSTFVPSVIESVASTWQGFFLESSTAGTLTIPASARTTGGALLKSGNAPMLALELAASDGPQRDRAAVLRFDDDASTGEDRFDARKLEPIASTFVSVGLGTDSDALRSVDARPTTAGSFSVPLHVESVGAGASLVLSWDRVLSLPETWSLTLRDLLTGASTNLRGASSYAFSVTPEAARPEGPLPSVTAAKASGDARFVLDILTSRGSGTEGEVDALIFLNSPRPNPAVGETAIAFSLERAATIRLSVIDARGREVALIREGNAPVGAGTAAFDTSVLASGVYTIRLESDGEVATRRLVVTR